MQTLTPLTFNVARVELSAMQILECYDCVVLSSPSTTSQQHWLAHPSRNPVSVPSTDHRLSCQIELLSVLWTRGHLSQEAVKHRASGPNSVQWVTSYLWPHFQWLMVGSLSVTLMADVEAAELMYKHLPQWMPMHGPQKKRGGKRSCSNCWEQRVSARSWKPDKLKLTPH